MKLSENQAGEIRAIAKAAGIPDTGEMAVARGTPPEAFRAIAYQVNERADPGEINGHHNPGSAPVTDTDSLDPAAIYAAREAAAKGVGDG